MSAFRRAIGYVKPYRRSLFLSIFFNVLYTLFTLLSLSVMLPILKILFNEKKNYTAPTLKNIWDLPNYLNDYINYFAQEFIKELGAGRTLIIVCISFLVVFFFRNIFNYLGEMFLMFIKTGITKTLRDILHQKILQLPISFFSEKRKGDMISRITNDVGEVEGSILGSFVDTLRSPIQIVVYIIWLLSLNYRLTLFALLIFPTMGTFMSILGKSLKRGSKRTQGQLGRVISSVEETLTGLKVIKIFNADDQIHETFEETTSLHKKLLNKVLLKQLLSSPVSEFLGVIIFCLVIYYGGILQLQGYGMEGSEFISYISIFYMLLDPIKSFAKSLSNIKKGEAAAERIFEIIDTPVVIEDQPNAIEKNTFDEAIRFENVSFKYEEHNVIQDFNLTIPKGKMVALVGSSGSGKSTIANLLTRFYDVTEGKITLDNINIKDIKLKSYRGLFGMVTQDSILFNDTVYNNLCLGLKDVPMEKVIEAAKIANAHEFIEKLEDGYNTNIGEGGGKLSGGQKQRMSIARAVLHDNPILVLDEATSALDSHSEKLVQEALNNMMKDRTSLVIAHRLSTIQNADFIVVMSDGHIIEQGSHEELMAKNGNYKRLIELQQLKN